METGFKLWVANGSNSHSNQPVEKLAGEDLSLFFIFFIWCCVLDRETLNCGISEIFLVRVFKGLNMGHDANINNVIYCV